MPKPQALVAFITALFVLLIAAHPLLGLAPVPAAVISVVLAAGLGLVVDRRIPDDDADVTDQVGDIEEGTPSRE
jgi:hypothetical protein